MWSSLKVKVSAGFVAVALCCAAIAGVLVDRDVSRTTFTAFSDRLSYEATMLAQMTAAALFGEVDPTDTSLNESVRALGAAVHTGLAVIANDGTIVADSERDDSRGLGSQAAAPEIVAARARGEGLDVRSGRLFVARAIVRDGKTLGFARASVPLSEVSDYVVAVRKRMAYGSAAALVVALLLGLALASRIVRPIYALSEGARRVGAGDFTRPIDVRTGDELGKLASAFNEMTRNLDRTVSMLDGRNRDMRAVLDNVTQALFTIDRRGVISSERSAIFDTWFGAAPEGATFVDHVLSGDPRAAASFALQWEQLIDGFLPVELVLDQLPKRIQRGERTFEVSYSAIDAGGVEGGPGKLLIVVTDSTQRIAAERAEVEQREVASLLERATHDRAGVMDFLVGTAVQVDELTAAARSALAETRRTLDTLKGNCGVFGMQRIATLCHEIETRMHEEGGDLTADEAAALRTRWATIADRLLRLLGDSSQVVIDDSEYTAALKALLGGAPRAEVAQMVLEWRTERVEHRFRRFADQARALAQRLDKGPIDVRISSGDVRLPRDEMTRFWAAFVHVVRNAVDHGLEPEAERALRGKRGAGEIRLSASRDDRSVVIEVADDGRGIDWEAVATRAKAMGLPATDRASLVSAMFADGLSTKDGATETSGRGVGLAALREACDDLGARIAVESEAGRGSVLRFHIPLRAVRPVAPLVHATTPPQGARAEA